MTQPTTKRLLTEAAGDARYRFINGNEVSTGQETLPRAYTIGAQSITSGTLRLTYFSAQKTEVITQCLTYSVAAAAATPTLCRVGLWRVEVNDDLTLAASIGNTTSLWATANTEYISSFTTSYNLTAGTRYAIGVLVVTSATAPTLTSGATTLSAMLTSRAPRLCGTVASLSDLPSTITAGTVGDGTSMLYAVIR